MIATIACLALARPAVAQTAAPAASDDQRQDRRAEVAAQLDLLRATDLQLKAEADRLQSAVAEHEQQADSARREAAAVEEQLQGLQVEVGDARDAVELQKLRLRERAVAAYIHPTPEAIVNTLAARDYDTAHKQRVLLAEVALHDEQVLQDRTQAEDALRDKRDQVEEGHRKLEALRDQREAELAAAKETRDRHTEVQQALEQRISEFQAEADEMAAAQGAVSAVIAQHASDGSAGGGTDAGGPTELAGPPTTAAPPATSAPTPTTAAAVIRSTAGTAAPSSVTSAPKTPTPTAAAGVIRAASVPPTTAKPAPTTAKPAPTTTKATPTTARATPTTTAPKATGLRLGWPISGVLTSPFGMRWGRMHQGIDLAAVTGTPIRSAAAGTVIYCGVMSGYGNVAMIDHLNGIVTLYAHQSRLACSVGQKVGAGQVIGYVGSTGNSTGPHLHFETRVRGVAVDPMQYLR